MADHLYGIASDGMTDSLTEKTAAEIESEMEVYLQGSLGPLLDTAKEAAEYIRNDEVYKRFQQELKKWLA